MTVDRISALRKALELSPDNHVLRLLLAEALRDSGQTEKAIAEYESLLMANQLPPAEMIPAGELALVVNNTALAARFLDAALRAGIVAGTAALQTKLDACMAAQGAIRVILPTRGTADAPRNVDHLEKQAGSSFVSVGGLDEVKKTIDRLIILPLMRPDLYQRYGKKPGGGVLLYGPPGCGKTLLARATAGECQLPFLNVRIEDILDPYMGVSERNLHEAFAQARANAPCVVFIDEFDAMAYARRKQGSSAARTLVDQMLQELDAIGAENRSLLVMAATNAPWDVDDALLRPGRFDRRIFVPPPDETARTQILKLLLFQIPSAGLDLRMLAQSTPLFSGADLRALVEQAVDLIIDEALSNQTEPPLTIRQLDIAQMRVRPTTLDWLERARNYVEFANRDDRYTEIAAFLQSREVRQRKR